MPVADKRKGSKPLNSPSDFRQHKCEACGRSMTLPVHGKRIAVPFHIDYEDGQRCPQSGRRMDA